ncbi:MAG: M1 family aminopeptidase [Acidobacteriota bacterium]
MKSIKRSLSVSLGLLIALLFAANPVAALYDQSKETIIDLTHYKIEAELLPDSHTLRATTAVTFQVLKSTQSVIFELNGSLKVSQVSTEDGRELQFVQDSLDQLNVRVDLGSQVSAGQQITLKFKYEGNLISPDGGVLPNKRLAYIGAEGSYLTYAARWFPFYNYASDLATYEISLITPPDFTVVGFSSEERQSRPYQPAPPEVPTNAVPTKATPVKPVPSKGPQTEPPSKTAPGRPKLQRGKKPVSGQKSLLMPVAYFAPSTPVTSQSEEATPASPRNIHTFISKVPVLVGTFAAARYSVKTIQSGGIDVEVYIKPGSESASEKFGQDLSNAVNLYNSQFGPYAFGKRLVIAEIDNESLESYTTAGITLLAERIFKERRDSSTEMLYREAAYQWWGQAVALKSFDDAWISQGLAQYSALLVYESQSSEGSFRDTAREAMERALAFESQTSITRAPIELDDQSEAYRSIVLYKGAFVYRMLRNLIGSEKFDAILKSYYTQYRGRQASIDDFEALMSKEVGRDMRYFFGQWVDSTGVPEFKADYQMIRTKDGAFKVRGTINQDIDSFNMPVDLELVYEGGTERTQFVMEGKSSEFTFLAKGRPIDIVVDPDSKLLKISDGIRVSVIVRRGIEHFRNEEYPEAEQQFQAAIKLNRSSSWAWYNLGLLYFAQKNFQKANDTFAEALELDLQPRWVEVWSYIKRGNCYDALGQRERAVAEYQKAIQVGDNYDRAQEVVQQYLSAPYRRNQPEQTTSTK